MAAGLAVLIVSGCAEDIDEDDLCGDLVNRCTTQGDSRCSGDNGAIEVCRANDDGCLVWSESETCGANMTCDESGGAPECVCSDACSAEGDSRCSGTVIQRCERDADGCLGWGDVQNCADDSRSCDDSGDDAVCVEGCTNECGFASESRCNGTMIQRCAAGDDGCLEWQDFHDCADDGLECDDSSGDAVCTGECVSDCDTEGAGRCNLTVIQECLPVTEGCLQWTDVLDCAASSRVCDDSSGSPICTGGCSDVCTTPGETRCQGDVIQTCLMQSTGCLDWEDTTDCADDGFVCNDSSGTPECACPPSCTDGELRCRGTVIQTCALQSNGCYDFSDTTDCADDGFVCDASSGTPECVCPPTCADGETRCSGEIIQTCSVQSNGCLDFQDTEDCTDSGLVCDDRSGTAMCVEGRGESCTDLAVVTLTPYVVSGLDFTLDFADDHTLGDTSCMTRTGSSEAVFAVDLTAGRGVLVREMGGLDVVTSFQSECGDAGVCILSEDYGETTGHRYTAASDERLYIIIEAWSSSPSSTDYEIHIDIVDPEDCGDGVDNDMDGDVDCDDSDCFGDPTYCSTETNCSDGADNDGDTLVDCDDDDCDADPVCRPYMGYYEKFETEDEVDISGYLLTFTPDSGDPNLYTWGLTPGITGYGVSPGSGTVSAALTLADDSYAEHALSVMSEVRLFEVSHASVFVGSNGNVTFGEGHSGTAQNEATFFGHARVAGLYRDLNPSSAGTVTVDEFADRIAVTYDAVAQYGSATTLNSFQVVINSSGVVDVYFVDLQSTTGMIGLSNGAGNIYPDETDFIPSPPPSFAHINEVVYDNDGVDSREFIEIYAEPSMGLTGYTLVHYDGASGGAAWALDLDSVRIPPDGFVVIGDAGVAELDVNWSLRGITAVDALENDQESLVLYTGWDGSTGTVIDAVGWGTAANFMGEGTPASEIEFESWDNSIGRYPDAADTDYNGADFFQSWWDTPGEPNTPPQPEGWARVTGSTQGSDTYPVDIPDNDATGVDLTITSPAWLPATITDIHVGVKISHTFTGDLLVNLTSPASTTVTLHNNTGGGTDDIFTVYDLETTPGLGSMDSFDGQSTSPGTGTWTLHVDDTASADTGQVLEWILWVQ